MLEPTPLPDELRRLVEQNLARAGPGFDCLKCDAACCETSGFAVLANVAQAYERYAAGFLNFQFQPGLSAGQFLHQYFDVVRVTPQDCPGADEFQVLFPRSLVNASMLVSIVAADEEPGGEPRQLTLGEYYANRRIWRERNAQYPWSCAFYNGSLPRRDGLGRTFAGCVLHSEMNATHLTAKPLDCVFGVCHQPPALLPPGPEAAARWLAAVGRYCAAAGPQR